MNTNMEPTQKHTLVLDLLSSGVTQTPTDITSCCTFRPVATGAASGPPYSPEDPALPVCQWGPCCLGPLVLLESPDDRQMGGVKLLMKTFSASQQRIHQVQVLLMILVCNPPTGGATQAPPVSFSPT